MIIPQKVLIRSKNGEKRDHMPKEQSPEVCFKSIKVTLSEEALMLLDELKKAGSFRSNSMTIEESIRAVHDIMAYLMAAIDQAKHGKPIPTEARLTLARDITIRLARFLYNELSGKMNLHSAGT